MEETDEDMIKEWVAACAIHLADTIEQLIVVSYAHIEALPEDEQAEFKRRLLNALECRVLDLASRVTVAMLAENGETIGDVIGHFTDHAVAAHNFQLREMNPLNRILNSVFEHVERVATDRAAKRHSEGN